MKVFDSIASLAEIEKGWALTIGNFDGVHLGHQEIIRAVKAASAKFGAVGSAVMTFDPHPVAILHPEKAPPVLTPLCMKKHLLEGLGIDCLIVLKDTLELLNLGPSEFVDEFLVKLPGPVVVVEGPNFNFGYGRSGDIATLKELASSRNFKVIEVEGKKIHLSDRRSVVCSSSLIRNLLESGDVSGAKTAMGRFYRLVGRTISGRGVGRQIGFPTANIEPVEQIIPAEGVYAGFVAVGESMEDVCVSQQVRGSAFSIGRAKTFISGHPLMVEAHILDGKVEDLSGQWLAMDFVRKIRNQKRFENREALREQIAKDCDDARTILYP